MKRWAISLLMLAIVALTAISWNWSARHAVDSSNKPQEPPFTVRFADLTLHVPEGPGIYRASHFTKDKLKIDLCDGDKSAPLGLCREMASGLAYSISLFITEPRPGQAFKLFKERPVNIPTPPPSAMLLVPQEDLSQDIGDDSEAYELSRIQSLGVSQILTTERGWPIAACFSKDHGRACGVGFLIQGAFVELRFFGGPGPAYDQAEVWAVASAVDAKIRSLMPAP